jgi:hypothetical protein
LTIALAGAHRVGKTTLAKAFAEKNDYAFVPSRAGEAFKELGLVVGQPLTPDERMTVQEKILDYHRQDITADLSKPWITDRSALDFAAYILMDAAHNHEYDHARVERYMQDCFAVSRKHYGTIVLVQPGITYVEEEGKPKNNPSQQLLMTCTLNGLFQRSEMDSVRCVMIYAGLLTVEERIRSLESLTELVIAQEKQEQSTSVIH